MRFEISTKRLMLKVCSQDYADRVLSFINKNRVIFEEFEPKKKEDFYSLRVQESILTNEYNATLSGNHLRYYVFIKNKPDTIIGTVSFANVLPLPYMSCVIGYKFDKDYWHNGYARESIEAGINEIVEELNIHRIIAYIRPDNTSSIQLIQKLGFENEGIERKSLCIQRQWMDHYRYALLCE